MELAVDLHAHSVFAGGTQSLQLSPEKMVMNRKIAISHLKNTNKTMPLKGIDLIGTGDCQFSIWNEILKENLKETDPGLFTLKTDDKVRYVLQTELILTAPIKKRSKIVHIVFLFPDFNVIETFRAFLDRWDVKYENMARPFLRCKSSQEVSERIFEIMDIDSLVEVIPAHIMTPQGIFGSNIRVNYLKDFFGSVYTKFQIFETGLSADPEILALIPELDDRVLISSSDAHSSALHRMGREFTILSMSSFSYSNLISALRRGKILLTAEFPPEEGRFFLTGHRAGRKSPGVHGKDEFCFFSPKHVPNNDICPICNKPLTIGVYQRCIEISRAQGANREIGTVKTKNKFIRMVPLIEIISYILKIKTKTAKSTVKQYRKIIELIGTERNLWLFSSDRISSILTNYIEPPLIEAILQVKEGNFTFYPYGYDGQYGELTIGKRSNYDDVKVIQTSKPIQKTL